MEQQIKWPAGYDRNDIEHVLGKHVRSARRDCGHCAWFFAPPPRILPKIIDIEVG